MCNKDDSEKEDYLSLDVLPTGWESPIERSNITIMMPEKADWSKGKITYGAYGSTTSLTPGKSDGKVKTSVSGGGKVLTIDAGELPKGHGMTLSLTLPEGYWEGAKDNAGAKNMIPLIPIAGAIIMLLLWIFNGRDPEVVKPVEFYPPDGLTPAEVGYLVDGRLDTKDLSSMIMYFASKGYIQIKEKGKKKYELIAVAPIADSELEFAKTIYKGLFSNARQDDEGHQHVDMDDLPSSFAEKIEIAKTQIKTLYDTGEKRMFTERSKAARAIGSVITIAPMILCMLLTALATYRLFSGIAALFPLVFALAGMSLTMGAFDRWYSNSRVSNVAQFAAGILIFGAAIAMSAFYMLGNGLGFIPVAALAIGGAVSLAMEVLMWARTKENAAVLGRVLGFRNFIEKAEYERIKLLSEENPEYYYDIMPYAFVMGMSVAWAKKFENLKIPEPEWARGVSTGDLYSAMWYSNMMNSCSSQFASQSIVIDSSDSGGLFTGGGFSGGGFSGGGFGGGGGGSW